MTTAKRFTSAWDTECDRPGCEAIIESGEEAGYIGSDLACEGCCDEHDEGFDI